MQFHDRQRRDGPGSLRNRDAPQRSLKLRDRSNQDECVFGLLCYDAAGGTIVVHGKTDQTFTVASDAKITGAASLSAITAGQHVKISYTKSADGATMTASAITVK